RESRNNMNADQDLLRKTLKMVGVMLGALTVFMGTLTILVVVVLGNAMGPRSSPADSKVVPASNVHGRPGDKPGEAEPSRPRGSQMSPERTPGLRPVPEPSPGTNRAI